jgi:hypothetical protein
MQTATGYGRKLTTRYKVEFEGKKRRIYCTCFSNSGSLWFMAKNTIVINQKAYNMKLIGVKTELQNLILHHVKEIKYLINSECPYKHENIALLKKELDFFISQLNKE